MFFDEKSQKGEQNNVLSLREKCSYLGISGPYLVWMREKTDQKNSKYGHFSRSDKAYFCSFFETFYQKTFFLSK